MKVRLARKTDLPSVMNVLDGAALAVSTDTVERRIESGHVLVACTDPDRAADSSGTVVGALVAIPRPTGVHVEAIAVRPGRRGQGIGSAVLRDAADRWQRLTASFDRSVSDFYRTNGFDIAPTGERCFGELLVT